MKINTFHLFVAGATLAMVATVATVARADGIIETKQQVVRYSDLDLSSDTDARVLYSRIKVAAGRACDAFDGHSVSQQMLRRNCVHEAIGRAVADVNAPALSALHVQRQEVRIASAR